MRRLAWMAAVLALAVPAAGCGTPQKQKEVEPSGNGETESPDTDIDSVDALRSTTVEIQGGQFTPPRIGLKTDNNAKFVNRDSRAYTLVGRTTVGKTTFRTVKLRPGESVKRGFKAEGDVEVSIKGTGEKMTVGVFY